MDLRQRLARRWGIVLRDSGIDRARQELLPPRYPGLRLTPKRLLNYWLVRYQRARGHTRLAGYPLSLTFEATNVCNLRCPYCFTGAGEVARERSMMPMELYRRLLDELGDHALQMDFYNWGEPLLNKNIYEMIRLASDKGVSTIVSTNFSLPFDRERAEALVASGLHAIGAGIDGARQESLERYRVGADFEKIIQNMRLLVDAKRALGSDTPLICWAFHVFEHNRHEVEEARSMARDLGVEFEATKGWVAGKEWDSGSEFRFPPGTAPGPQRCKYLWSYAIVNNDGRVAPCAASFYQEDDFGSLEDASFRAVWNNRRFREARRLFRLRSGAGPGARLICYGCPYTLAWENYQRHLAQGLPESAFDPGYTTNDWFNYFFDRRPHNDGLGGRSDLPAPGSAESRRRPGRA